MQNDTWQIPSNEEINRILNMKKTENTSTFLEKIICFIVGGLIGVVIAAPLFIYFTWAYAYTGSILWSWFIVPVFGLAPLTISQAWGVSILIAMWTQHQHEDKCKDERNLPTKIIMMFAHIIRPWGILFIAWICHSYFFVPPAQPVTGKAPVAIVKPVER